MFGSQEYTDNTEVLRIVEDVQQKMTEVQSALVKLQEKGPTELTNDQIEQIAVSVALKLSSTHSTPWEVKKEQTRLPPTST